MSSVNVDEVYVWLIEQGQPGDVELARKVRRTTSGLPKVLRSQDLEAAPAFSEEERVRIREACEAVGR